MKNMIAVVLLMMSQLAHAADGMGKVSAYYGSHSSTTNGVTGSNSRLVYDVNADYRFSGSNFVLGATYQSESQATSSGAGISRTSYGVTGGYVDRKDSGFLLLATYYISSTLDTMTGGSGYQIDGGYKFSPGHIPIGMQLSYKHYDYSKFNYSESYIDPSFFVQFEF